MRIRGLSYAFSVSSGAALLAACALPQAQSDTQLPIAIPGSMAPATAQRVLSTGTFKVLHKFRGTAAADGEQPQASLIDVKGTLYGTTNYGGSHGDGTVYSMSVSGSEKVIYSFQGGADGRMPQAGLVNVNGTLYGTTSSGGGTGCYGYGCGTVYSVSTTGSEQVLHTFTGGSDGASPEAGLTDVNGTLYGTTLAGGSSDDGTVYSISTTGSEKVIYTFGGGSDGAGPDGGLIDVKGMLYGTTINGGSSDVGTVYSVTTDGLEKVLFSFAGTKGGNPRGSLVDMDGKLYGTTSAGGKRHDKLYHGTVYRITTSGVMKVLYRFSRHIDGWTPYARLIAMKGTLYGTTDQGGRHLDGTVYDITTTGSEQVLHHFSGPGGSHPWAGLTNVKGTLYGTTLEGGSGCSDAGCGTVFELTP